MGRRVGRVKERLAGDARSWRLPARRQTDDPQDWKLGVGARPHRPWQAAARAIAATIKRTQKPPWRMRPVARLSSPATPFRTGSQFRRDIPATATTRRPPSIGPSRPRARGASPWSSTIRTRRAACSATGACSTFRLRPARIGGRQKIGTEVTNDFGKPGYGGPCPPKGHGPASLSFQAVRARHGEARAVGRCQDRRRRECRAQARDRAGRDRRHLRAQVASWTTGSSM